MELLLFLLQVFVISLSGALQPGPVTAAAITMGSRNRFAGTLMALGHAVIEFPLMVLLIFGVGRFLKLPAVSIGIGLAGGAFLVYMAKGMFKDLRADEEAELRIGKGGPVLTGIVLTGGSPYFLVWWATVGLTLVTTARGFGVWAFVLFAFVHWLCDCVWLTILSWGSFKGASILNPRRRRAVLLFCAVALLGFGLYFIGDKSVELIRLLRVIPRGESQSACLLPALLVPVFPALYRKQRA
jgi:threonine/homoserine/homoserine lactone efflux protein